MENEAEDIVNKYSIIKDAKNKVRPQYNEYRKLRDAKAELKKDFGNKVKEIDAKEEETAHRQGSRTEGRSEGEARRHESDRERRDPATSAAVGPGPVAGARCFSQGGVPGRSRARR